MTPEEIAVLTDIELLTKLQEWIMRRYFTRLECVERGEISQSPHEDSILVALRAEALRRMKNNPPVDVPF